MPIETNVTLKDVSLAFCDRCNVEQALTHGFFLLPVMVKHEASLKSAGWEERDEGFICPGCVSEEQGNDTETEAGLGDVAAIVGAKKCAACAQRKKGGKCVKHRALEAQEIEEQRVAGAVEAARKGEKE